MILGLSKLLPFSIYSVGKDHRNSKCFKVFHNSGRYTLYGLSPIHGVNSQEAKLLTSMGFKKDAGR